MSVLSSLSNGGLSGVTTSLQGAAPVCGLTMRSDSGLSRMFVETIEGGSFKVYEYLPQQEGEVLFHKPSAPLQVDIPYVSVYVDGVLEWRPALIYGTMVNRTTGDTYR